MSVLIKEMEMPENCYYCALGIYEYPCGFTNQEHLCKDGRPPDCPLVEVPPHGRLIDADALLASENQHYEYHSDSFYVETRTIELAPVIIESEEDE